MMAKGTERVLRGRERERALLADLLRRTMIGHGGAALIHGDPGIGKSALLDDAVQRVTGMRILRVTCVEPEADLGYAMLHRLLTPALTRMDRLAAPQADALRTVFGLAAGATPDRFLVGLATLSLLSELAAEQPLVCLVDDAQWADRPSLHVLEFVARRLAAEPIAVLIAARTEAHPLVVSGVFDVPLTGLDRESARELLLERAGAELSAAQQETILDAAVGNPLALRELPAGALRANVLPEPLPLADELRHAFLRRVRRLDEPTQQLLLVIAADGHTSYPTLRRAFAVLAPGVEWTPTGLDALDDLLSMDESAVIAFRHPLIRSAVYYGAGPDERRRAHRALATALHGDDDAAERRAWHLGQAADGQDEEVAAELEQSAYRAARISSATAAALLARSAELSTPGRQHARRSFESAAAWWVSGDFDRAATMLADISRTDRPGKPPRWDVLWLRASLELHVGNPAAAVSLLRPVLGPAADTSVHFALPLLVLFNEAAFCADADAWTDVAAAAERLAPSGDEVDDVLARLLRGSCRLRAGKDPGLAPGDLDAVEQLTDPARLWWASGFMLGLGHKDRARRLCRLAVQHARRLGAAVFLPWALWRVASDDLAAGRFRSAEAFAEEGRQIAEETGQINAALALRGSLAMLAALRGQEETARALARNVIDEGMTRGMAGAVVIAHRALGLLELAADRPEQALEHLAPRASGSYLGLAMVNVPDLVEAAIAADRPELVTEPLAAFTRWADTANLPDLCALAARCRALTSSGDTATAEFRRALEFHARADHPLEHARTQFLYGQHLRRERRPTDARDPLRTALTTFESLGAGAWADRTHNELRAAGETRKTTTTDHVADLTPQEARIVEAVSSGLTNREIAAQLFLSPRTIDYHLRKVFAKMGVSSRAELTKVVLHGGGTKRPLIDQ
ncbi:helix-turn-helix transcriptional regulator [Nocardia wallacei]|uniref:Transcriptional regulator n=2 Tax=Nocardia wallacei TaxID=480035 RepID=A0A7G1KFY2_9NOCA|nr:LuxR family transcriptional regulator [Nocardia wallacei]BCK54015.1 transcriptional regulator [Nocardia wallacei]